MLARRGMEESEGRAGFRGRLKPCFRAVQKDQVSEPPKNKYGVPRPTPGLHWTRAQRIPDSKLCRPVRFFFLYVGFAHANALFGGKLASFVLCRLAA